MASPQLHKVCECIVTRVGIVATAFAVAMLIARSCTTEPNTGTMSLWNTRKVAV